MIVALVVVCIMSVLMLISCVLNCWGLVYCGGLFTFFLVTVVYIDPGVKEAFVYDSAGAVAGAEVESETLNGCEGQSPRCCGSLILGGCCWYAMGGGPRWT